MRFGRTRGRTLKYLQRQEERVRGEGVFEKGRRAEHEGLRLLEPPETCKIILKV